jgi:hypothetical protein
MKVIITFIRYAQNRQIGKPGITFIRYAQNRQIGKPGIPGFPICLF